MLERRAGEELFRKHVATVVAGGLAALAAESQPASGTSLAKGASTGAAPSASGPPAPSPLKEAGSGDGGSAGPTGSRLLDTMAFLNDLGRWVGGWTASVSPALPGLLRSLLRNIWTLHLNASQSATSTPPACVWLRLPLR